MVLYVINAKANQLFFWKLSIKYDSNRLYANIASSPPTWMKKMISTVNEELKYMKVSYSRITTKYNPNLYFYVWESQSPKNKIQIDAVHT